MIQFDTKLALVAIGQLEKNIDNLFKQFCYLPQVSKSKVNEDAERDSLKFHLNTGKLQHDLN